MIDIPRLKANLTSSQLQKKDNAIYQVIIQLITIVEELQKSNIDLTSRLSLVESKYIYGPTLVVDSAAVLWDGTTGRTVK